MIVFFTKTTNYQTPQHHNTTTPQTILQNNTSYLNKESFFNFDCDDCEAELLAQLGVDLDERAAQRNDTNRRGQLHNKTSTTMTTMTIMNTMHANR